MRLSFLSIALTLCAVGTVFSQPAKHVILISIDAFRPDYYLDKSWPAPGLQKMMAEGVHAKEVNSVVPSVTYPSHTAIVTCAAPARHGIYYNDIKDAANGAWYWEEAHIKVPTLWDAVKEAGLTAGAVMWPVTVGAPIDYNFPVRRANKDEQGDPLTITRPYVNPANLLDEIEKATHRKFEKSDFDHEHKDQTIGSIANHIIATHKPALMAIHFLSMDHVGHEHGRDGKELRESLALVDSLVSSVLATVEKSGLKDNTAIIITGDHGMVAKEQSLAPNMWLAQNGLLEKAEFYPAGGSAFLYLKDSGDKATLRKVEKVLKDVSPQYKKLFRVVNRKQLDALGVNPDPALALAFAKGVTFSRAVKGDIVKPSNGGGAHGYFPDFPEIRTGFIALGAGINTGVSIPVMSIQDIAPLVSELLGLDFKAPDGRLHRVILKD